MPTYIVITNDLEWPWTLLQLFEDFFQPTPRKISTYYGTYYLDCVYRQIRTRRMAVISTFITTGHTGGGRVRWTSISCRWRTRSSRSLCCCGYSVQLLCNKSTTHWTRMWANAQRDGRPAKHRWRPLFNAPKFGWRPLQECRAVALARRETRWNLLGCPKLPNRSHPL